MYKNKKVLFLPTLNNTIVHYRMGQYIKGIRKDGLKVAFSYDQEKSSSTCQWEHTKDLRLFDLLGEKVKEADAVVFQTIHTQLAAAFFSVCRYELGKKVITELDDDIYSVSVTNPAYKSLGAGSEPELWGHDQIEHSDALIVSTNYLKKLYWRKHRKKIYVVPNAIDFSVWDRKAAIKPPKKDGEVRILYSGGSAHGEDLALIKDVFSRITEKHKNVVFYVLIGDYCPDFLKNNKQIIVRDHKHWVPIYKYPRYLKSIGADIGIAPLVDSQFNRCKSNLKWLEYSALGIPTVASDIEPYKCIKNGLTGYRCKTVDQFYAKLDLLVRRVNLRSLIGYNAYKDVRENYNTAKVSQQYATILKGA